MDLEASRMMLFCTNQSADTNTWSKPSVRGKVPSPRASFASNVIGRKLYLFGGGRIWDEGPVFNDTYSYDIGTVHIIPYYTLDIVIWLTLDRSVWVGETSCTRCCASNSARRSPIDRTQWLHVHIWRTQLGTEFCRPVLLGRCGYAVLHSRDLWPSTSSACLSLDGQIRQGTSLHEQVYEYDLLMSFDSGRLCVRWIYLGRNARRDVEWFLQPQFGNNDLD